MSTAQNWLIAAVMAFALGASWLLDLPPESDAIQSTADSVIDAQLAAQTKDTP